MFSWSPDIILSKTSVAAESFGDGRVPVVSVAPAGTSVMSMAPTSRVTSLPETEGFLSDSPERATMLAASCSLQAKLRQVRSAGLSFDWLRHDGVRLPAGLAPLCSP